tara:strand:- start:171 stop:365 length:195 start_codon:yes stop_codon:yes gene_type:complete
MMKVGNLCRLLIQYVLVVVGNKLAIKAILLAPTRCVGIKTKQKLLIALRLKLQHRYNTIQEGEI